MKKKIIKVLCTVCGKIEIDKNNPSYFDIERDSSGRTLIDKRGRPVGSFSEGACRLSHGGVHGFNHELIFYKKDLN